jgi:16S rRNA (guanine966-N2)-methyltransferase
MIQTEIADASFLDLFAGAGSVGLEALSRGAARATFVECAPRHAACLAANVAALKAEARVEIVRADAFAWPGAGGQGRAFDIAYADPPYALVAEQGYGPLLAALAEAGTVRPGGLFIAEMATRQAAAEHPMWELCRDRAYGQTRLAVYRNVCGKGE